jgi:hypothetical protein
LTNKSRQTLLQMKITERMREKVVGGMKEKVVGGTGCLDRLDLDPLWH